MSARLKWIVVGLIVLALILVPFLLWEEGMVRIADGLSRPGGPALALLALAILALFALDVVLPVPSSLVSVAAIALFGWSGGLLIWAGMTAGCALGYALGSSAGRPLAKRFLGAAEVARAGRIAGDVGPAALVLTRAVPVLAEAATIAAGLAAMPFGRFMLTTGLANAGIALVYSALGSAAGESAWAFAWLLGAAVGVPALGWGLIRLAGRPRAA